MLVFLCFTCLAHTSVCFWNPRRLPCDVTSANSSVIFDCKGRKLSEVPLHISANATKLDLSENRISTISNDSFWNLSNLTFLNLNLNRIEDGKGSGKKTFSGLVQLRTLLLDGNSLSRVPEDLPHGLTILSLSSNKIEYIASKNFRHIPKIAVLRLNKNCYFGSNCKDPLRIENATFAVLTNLKNLSLTHNRLRNIPPNLPESLVELKLHLNTIQHVGKSELQSLTQLKVLDLSGNCPQCLNAPFPCKPCQTESGSMDIDANAFSDLSNLEELRLSGNSLKKVPSLWFQNLTQLKYLYLSFNFLVSEIATGEFLSVLPHVEIIDFSFNRNIKSYPVRIQLSKTFSKLKSLKTLHMEGYDFQKLNENDLRPLYSLTNLSVLNLGTNFLEIINLPLFHNFFNLSFIYMAENKLTFSFQRGCSACMTQSESEGDSDQDIYPEKRYGPYIHKDEENRFYPASVKQECLIYGPVLDLSKNNIFYINPKRFKGVENTTCLNLSANSIVDSFNGTEFIHFPNLNYLDLSYNKMYMSHDYAFSELKNLKVLDLSHNKHYFVVTGVTHNLAFLKHLQFLKVLNLSWNEISTLTYKGMVSSSLEELQFQGNRLDIMWKHDQHYFGLFKQLKNLTHLDLSYNKLHHIPPGVYAHFPTSLKSLILSKNKLRFFDWQTLQYFHQLEELDLSENKLRNMTENLLLCTKTLRVLDLSYNRIAHLSDGFLGGAKSLQSLDLSFNRLTLLNHSTFLSGPDNYIKELSLKGNPFLCTCDLFDFILWIDHNDVKIPRLATEVTCNMPANKKGKGVIYLETDACINDSKAFMFYLISFSFVFCTMAVSVTLHLFYWDASYIFHLWRAKIKGYHYLRSTDTIYDAFVTYDTKDPLVSDWVLNHLRQELEENGDKLFPICLEERDWTPGAPVIENLSQSIRQSRKTVFVLTEAYVRSGIFKMAVYLAHQRLLDDNMDVMVLLLLQPVLRHSRLLRLRRRLCGRSILEWPRNPSAEHWFWQCLRNAIRVDNQVMYSKLYSSYFTSK
ncbi:toll-like receptor 8b [Megalops cyprinoides]|uniref:toll-like receptor 8b n=1 Tax=Megalops cyprinoides TaxID=118141 RepID=UPI001864C0C4|nr:toll-like receptor 8b [Megalops cyprinoides]